MQRFGKKSAQGLRNFVLVAAGIFVMGSAHFAAAANAGAPAIQHDSPVGYWKTIDDVSGKPKSIIKIVKTAGEELTGEVMRIFPAPGESADKRCEACRGVQHNQPIVGMVILSGLKPHAKQWGDGKILDPHNGKIYSCSLRLVEHGKKLKVHGYIGMPLFGRSQTWERVDLMSG